MLSELLFLEHAMVFYISEPFTCCLLYLECPPQICFLICNIGIIIASPTSYSCCEDYMNFKHLLGRAPWRVFSTSWPPVSAVRISCLSRPVQMPPHCRECFAAVSHNSFEHVFIKALCFDIIVFVLHLSTFLNCELHKGKESALGFSRLKASSVMPGAQGASAEWLLNEWKT